MIKYFDFEKKFYTRTAKRIYEIVHDSVRLLKYMADYDKSYYENLKY